MNSKFSLNKSRQIPDIVVSSEQSVVVIIAEGNFQLEGTQTLNLIILNYL